MDTYSTDELNQLNENLGGLLQAELERNPDVIDLENEFSLDSIPNSERTWLRLDDVVVVFADLKSSTSLGYSKHAASTAAILEASTGGLAKILQEFNADYVQVQGDGVFGVFVGNQRYERAVCAGITTKTYGSKLASKVASKWTDAPTTGIKVGVAAGKVLVKNVGEEDSESPVWVGRAVNYSAKCSQQADADEMIVTRTVWEWIEGNDFLTHSCDCGNPSDNIWDDFEVEHLPESPQGEALGRKLTSNWCQYHGAEYCAAVMADKKKRDVISDDKRSESKNRIWATRRSIIDLRDQRRNKDQLAHTKGLLKR